MTVKFNCFFIDVFIFADDGGEFKNIQSPSDITIDAVTNHFDRIIVNSVLAVEPLLERVVYSLFYIIIGQWFEFKKMAS